MQRIIEKTVEHHCITSVKNSGLKNELAICMQNMLQELEKDDENISYTQIWLQVNALFVFQYHIFGNIDKKILKRLIDANKKVGFTNCAFPVLHFKGYILGLCVYLIRKRFMVPRTFSNETYANYNQNIG